MWKTSGAAWCFFRDQERDSRVSVASTQDMASGEWTICDITDYTVDAWEPTLDTSRWGLDGVISAFVQECHQGDGERVVESEPTAVRVLDIKPKH